MALDLRLGTGHVIHIGPAVSSTNAVTTITSLTSGTVDEIGVFKNGATAITDLSGTAITHRTNGMYTMPLPTTAISTVGHLKLHVVDVSKILPIFQDYSVLRASAYDRKYGTTAVSAFDASTDTVQIGIVGSNLIRNASFQAAALSSNKLATGAVNAAAVAAAAVTKIQSGLSTFDPSATSVDVLRAVTSPLSTFDASSATVQIGIVAANLIRNASFQASALSSNKFATGAINAAGVAAAAVTKIQAGLSTFDPTASTVQAGSATGVNLKSILGTSLSEASGTLAAGFNKFYDVTTPSKDMNDVGVAGAGLTAADVWTYGTRVLTAGTNLNDFDPATDTVQIGIIGANLIRNGSFQANALSSDKVTAGFLNAAGLAGSATAEIQSGLSTFDPSATSVDVLRAVTSPLSTFDPSASSVDVLVAYRGSLSTFDPSATSVDVLRAVTSPLSTFDPDTDAVERASLTWTKWARVMGAACGGVLAGGATTTNTMKGMGISTVRITATSLDTNGNRPVIALVLT